MHGNNKQVIDLHHYTELTQMEVEFGTFHYRPPPCSKTRSGGYNNQKITLDISIESGIAILPIDIIYITLNSQMTNL